MCAIEYYTYDDYKQWKGDWELIRGIPLAMAPAPVKKHQQIAGKFYRVLADAIEDCQTCDALYEIDYKINEDTVLRPDIVITCEEDAEAYLTKAPKIVVEVISKATAKRDEVYKFEIYEAEKVLYYILVYPDDLKAKLYKLEGSKYDKQGDFTSETYEFSFDGCRFAIDFNKVFAKFRTRHKSGSV